VPDFENTTTDGLVDDAVTPGAMLWLALSAAPAEGASVADLMRSSGMNRTTLYRHLIDHSRAGRAVQVSRGRWRAAGTEDADAVP
jgi:S-DNA-T family DNA segregation ATPase FtsK/SpoIIIE